MFKWIFIAGCVISIGSNMQLETKAFCTIFCFIVFTVLYASDSLNKKISQKFSKK